MYIHTYSLYMCMYIGLSLIPYAENPKNAGKTKSPKSPKLNPGPQTKPYTTNRKDRGERPKVSPH